ncbi:hypothetical protein [Sphingopyxis sp.]|uniref:hypothetical protein n=1 Tax=Sphingopyxis sp. TaxID=1908224 RepID=UPI002622DD8D|nr:hypothetical protein [Sphingopyxis sp.]MCW0196812.1 hypothetical protein [Sphingopyxis sp.]
MSKKLRNRKAAPVNPATEVEVEFRLTIKEVHTRTTTICDQRSNTFAFDFGHDFEAARAWLESEETWTDLGDMCAEARDHFAAWREAAR